MPSKTTKKIPKNGYLIILSPFFKASSTDILLAIINAIKNYIIELRYEMHADRCPTPQRCGTSGEFIIL